MRNHWAIIFYCIIIILILNIFSKHYIYHKKLPNLVAKILAPKFGFVPDCYRKIPEKWGERLEKLQVSSPNLIYFRIVYNKFSKSHGTGTWIHTNLTETLWKLIEKCFCIDWIALHLITKFCTDGTYISACEKFIIHILWFIYLKLTSSIWTTVHIVWWVFQISCK